MKLMSYYVLKTIGTVTYFVNGGNILSQRPTDTFSFQDAVKLAAISKGEIVPKHLLDARLSTLPKQGDVWCQFGDK
jgi:hypothetical protein